MGNWYIVQCNPNCERKAVAEIRRAGFRAHMPKLARVVRHHRTKEQIIKRRPLMTGYIFMRFPDKENWYALRKCQGVKGVLYVDERPYRMPREHVAVIMRSQRGLRYDDKDTRAVRREMRNGHQNVSQAVKSTLRQRVKAGQRVYAPMTFAERVIARVLSVTKKGTVKAMIEMDGRELPVEFTD